MVHARERAGRRWAGIVAAALLVPAASLGLTIAAPAARAQAAGQAADAQLPPVSYTCPMHEEVIGDEGGICPICKMDLVPVRLVNVYTCPRHAVIQKDAPGVCPIDRLELIRVVMALTFTCPGQPEISQIEPGTCPDGSPMTKKYTARAHGNHNPQHGGQFFMASDQWHHLEGAYPAPGQVLVYLYDDFAKPLPEAQARDVKARVVTEETFDPKTRTTTEIKAFPLTLAKTGPTRLEASVGALTMPAKVTVKMIFKPGGPEERFDFTFESLTTDPPVARLDAGPTVAPAARRLAPQPRAPRVVLAAYHPAAAPRRLAPAFAQAPTLAEAPPPDTAAGILERLVANNAEIKDAVDRGVFNELWVPALASKDVAVYLEDHLDELAPADREPAQAAVARFIRAAWLLDAVGDLGNRPQIVEAYAKFAGALADIQHYFPGV